MKMAFCKKCGLFAVIIGNISKLWYNALCEFVSNGQMSKEFASNGEIYGAITGIQWNHYGGAVSLL